MAPTPQAGPGTRHQPFTAALIGLGNIAWRYDGGRATAATPGLTHASVYDQDPRTRLIAGFSPDAGERDEAQDRLGIQTLDSLDALLALRPDIVSVCSPSPLHAGHLRACFAAGVPMVWLEKPATTDLGDLDALIAQRPGTTVLVNFQRRYLAPYRNLVTLARTSGLGVCRHIQASYSRGLVVNGSHIVDQVLAIAGDNETFSLDWVARGGPADQPSFGLTFANGLTVAVTGIDLPYHCIDISAVFDEGRVSILHGGVTAVLERRVEHESFPGFYRLSPTPDPRFPARCSIADGMPQALNDLIAAHTEGRDPHSSLRTARLGQALVEAVLTRRADADRASSGAPLATPPSAMGEPGS